MKTQGKTLNEVLQQLKGIPVYAVEFVMDYVQLHFGESTLSTFTHPSLEINGKTLVWGAPGYRDCLCDLIAVPVTEAHVSSGEELKLVFGNGTILTVSLRDKDYRGPEALEFKSDSGLSWVA